MSDTPGHSTVFICSGGHRFDEIEMEMGMTHATMRYMTEQNDKEWNYESDLSIERDLGVSFLEDDAREQWPWYADEQWEVQEPEIIDV